jgi:hypothetical protein
MSTVEDLAILRHRIDETLARHGLTSERVLFAPASGDRAEVQVFDRLAQVSADPADDGFDEVIASAQQAEADQRAQRAIDELTEQLRRNGGFL